MRNRECYYYEFAGVKVSLSAPSYGDGHPLMQFRSDPQTSDIDYAVLFVSEIENPSGKLIYKDHGYEIYEQDNKRIRVLKYDETEDIVMMDIEEREMEHRVVFSSRYKDAWGKSMIMKILDIPRQMIMYDAIFLHASFITYNGQAVLFSGQKQIGKSTQAELWHKYKDAAIVNGDRAILRKINGAWSACGSPYSGTSKICENMTCPIKSIIILEQGKENMLSKINAKDAFVSLMKNCSYEAWDKKILEKSVQIMEKIISEVEFVKLSCVPDRSAADMLEEYLWKKEKE